MKSYKTLMYLAALALFSYGAIELTLMLEQHPGGIAAAFAEMGMVNVTVLFCLPLLAVVFSVYPPLMYPFVVMAYPLMWLWRKLKGVR
jgi:uncharacterized membrane protein YcgQ (UPF0703/DUF1980 family)